MCVCERVEREREEERACSEVERNAVQCKALNHRIQGLHCMSHTCSCHVGRRDMTLISVRCSLRNVCGVCVCQVHMSPTLNKKQNVTQTVSLKEDCSFSIVYIYMYTCYTHVHVYMCVCME